jgi:phosphoglucomutase
VFSSHAGASGNDLNITAVSVKPFAGQRPEISGLRKETKEFVQAGYVEAFVQSTFNAMHGSVSGDFSRSTLAVGETGATTPSSDAYDSRRSEHHSQWLS